MQDFLKGNAFLDNYFLYENWTWLPPDTIDTRFFLLDFLVKGLFGAQGGRQPFPGNAPVVEAFDVPAVAPPWTVHQAAEMKMSASALPRSEMVKKTKLGLMPVWKITVVEEYSLKKNSVVISLS